MGRCCWWLLFVGLTLLIFHPASASAESAQEIYSVGEKQYLKENFREAATSFQRAFDLSHFPGIWFDIGQAWRRVYEKDRTTTDARQRALHAYEEFLKTAHPEQQNRMIAEKFSALLQAEEWRDRAEALTLQVDKMGVATSALVAKAEKNWRIPLYKRGWLWGIVGTGAGVIVAIGLGVGLRPQEPSSALGGADVRPR